MTPLVDLALCVVAVVGMTFGFIMMGRALEYKLELVRVLGDIARRSPDTSVVGVVKEVDEGMESPDEKALREKNLLWEKANQEGMVDEDTMRTLLRSN